MEKIIELFECQIGDTTNAYPSIFSKDDVVTLLINLKAHVLKEVTELPKADTTGFTKEQIISSVKDLLNEYSWEDFIECEPELCGSYGGSYSLEMNTSFDEREFERSFLSELEDYFTPNDEQL